QSFETIGLGRVGPGSPIALVSQPGSRIAIVESALFLRLADAWRLGQPGTAKRQQRRDQHTPISHCEVSVLHIIFYFLSTNAWAIVPKSTYSNSLPAGTPRARRVTFNPRALSASPITWAVASPSAVKLVASITSF